MADAELGPCLSPSTVSSLDRRHETRVNCVAQTPPFCTLWELVETPSVESLEKLDGALESTPWGQSTLWRGWLDDLTQEVFSTSCSYDLTWLGPKRQNKSQRLQHVRQVHLCRLLRSASPS